MTTKQVITEFSLKAFSFSPGPTGGVSVPAKPQAGGISSLGNDAGLFHDKANRSTLLWL